jgi:hypothetical protein
MEKINDLFEQEVVRVNDAFPSIYTKDDVVSLLISLRTQVLNEASELNPIENISEDQFQEFRQDVSKSLERALCDGTIEVYDQSSAEFSIDYHNTIQIENIDVHTDNITDELENILLDQFQTHFKKLIK